MIDKYLLSIESELNKLGFTGDLLIMTSNGGISKRLTYEGGLISKISLWKDNAIYYASNIDSPQRVFDLRVIKTTGGQSNYLKHGMSTNIAISIVCRVSI